MEALMSNTVLLTHAAYLLLAAGLVLTALAIFSPGTGFLELAAFFSLALAGVGVVLLPVNWWALVVVAAGGVLFVFSLRRSDTWAFLAAAIAALSVGSAYLFQGDRWWLPAVHPMLALSVSLLSAGFFWIATRKYLEVSETRPSHDLEALVGALGEAKSDIHEDGSVQVAGELWSAQSERLIREGATVRVTAREGFSLVVEALSQEENGG